MSSLFGGGKQKTTTTIQLPGPSAAEQELSQLNLQLAKRQIASLESAEAGEAAFAASPLGLAQRRLEEKATENLLARLEGRAPVLSPEAQARIGTVFGEAERRGQADLLRFGEEIAGARGLSISDSPIGNELLRQRADLSRGLGAARAQSELDVGQTEALFSQSIADFQNRLRQQAFLNRLALAGAQPASFALQQNLFGQRMAAAPRTFSQSQTPSGLDVLSGFGALSGGVGGLFRGLAPFFGNTRPGSFPP